MTVRHLVKIKYHNKATLKDYLNKKTKYLLKN